MKSNLLKIAYAHFNAYSEWLKGQEIAQHEMRAQLCRLNHFLVFLGTAFSGGENVFTNGFRRDDALREYKLYLRQDLKSPSSSLNTTIESVDRFFQFIGLPSTRVTPDVQEPIKPLTDDQISRLESLAQSSLSARERALLWLMLHAGLIPQECALIDLSDVRLHTTGGHVMLGHGATRYQFALDARCRIAVREYLEERAATYPFADRPAFFIDQRGNRMTAAAVDLIVRQLGREVGLDITAKTVQQTFQYNEARKQNKALLAFELLNGFVQAG